MTRLSQAERSRRVVAAVAFLILTARRAGMADLAAWMERRRELVGAAVEQAVFAEAETEPPPPASRRTKSAPDWSRMPEVENVDLWTKAKRRDANVAALRRLAELDGAKPSAGDRRVLAGYSGWGGVVERESDAERIPEDLRPSSWRGLVDEYYTPTPLAAQVWRLLARLRSEGLLVASPRALEPAAGIGRFVAPAPEGIDWSLVELSPQSASLLRALYPDEDVFVGAFQEYMAAHPVPPGGDFDLVVTNPPYAKQGAYAATDRSTVRRDGKPWTKADHYFLHAAARRLRPGGIMVQLVPMGLIHGDANKAIRAQLLRMCHFVGAYAVPIDVFPGAKLALAVTVWRRRAADLEDVLPDDREVLAGKYFETAEGKANFPGRWASEEAAERGVTLWREGLVSVPGVEVDVAKMALRAGPDVAVPTATAPAASSKPKREAKVVAEVAGGPEVAMARALGERVQRFRKQLASEPGLAEAGRIELAEDVRAWVQAFGPPRDHALAQADDTALRAFVSVIDADGEVAPILGRRVEAVSAAAFAGDKSDLVAVVTWLSGRYGQTTWGEVRDTFRGSGVLLHALRDAGAAGKLAVELDTTSEEASKLWAMREYVSGDLYARLDAIDAQMASAPQAVAPYYAAQRAALLEAIDPLPIDAIEVDFRHGLVPEAAVGEWLTSLNGYMGQVTVRWEEGVLVADGRLSSQVEDVVAFANRQTLYQRKGETKKTNRHGKLKEVEERREADDRLLEDFNEWLRSQPSWSALVADAYNRRVRAHKPRAIPDAPLMLARAGEDVTLRAHQSVAIRRMTATRGGIVAHDVGLGKTFLACGLAAYWRQIGLARRPIIVVPKQVITNWVREIDRMMPGYRVVPVGITWSDRAKAWVEDDAAAKDEKWQAFASGQYDLAIATVPSFTAIPMNPEAKLAILERDFWLRREEKLAGNDVKLAQDKVTKLEAALQSAPDWNTKAVAQLTEQLETAKRELLRQTDREGYLRQEVERAEAALAEASTPKDRTAAKKKLASAEKSLAKFRDQGPTLRQLEAARQEFDAWRATLEYDRGQAAGVTWEEIGCDALILDEAQAFKNLHFAESRYGEKVKYLASDSGDPCKQCWDLYVKAAWLRDHNDGTGVVALTATPLKNSPLELYNLMRYVRPDAFERQGIRSHEEFIDRFCQFSQEIVLTMDGAVKQVPIVSGFKHLDELRSIMDLYVDVKTAEDVGLEVPESSTEQVMVQMTADQLSLYDQYRELGREAMRERGWAKGPDGKDMNLLSILAAMEKITLDPRQIDSAEGFDDFTPPKYAALARKVLERRDCGHIVFLTTGKSVDNIRRCKQALVAAGIPAERIATMYGSVTPAQRQAIVDGLNGVYEVVEGLPAGDGCMAPFAQQRMVAEPKYDVVIGNTVMQEGMNLQRRACAIHHVDLPWTPSDIQQRNGRGVRQGNEWACRTQQPVTLYYYLAEGSVDGYRLQLILGKKDWIETLIRPASTSANNPLAGATWSEEDRISIFAEDPETARAQIQARRADAEASFRAKRREEAGRRFQQFVARHAAARATADAQLAERYRAQAAQIRRVLEQTPVDVFERPDLLDVAEQRTVLWSPGKSLVLVEGEPCRVSQYHGSERRWVQAISPTGKTVTWRSLGELVPTTVTWASLEAYSAFSDPQWSEADDLAAIERRLNDRWTRLNPHELGDVAPDHIRRWWDLIWLRSLAFYDGPEGVPFLEGGEVVIRGWHDARSIVKAPIPPTDEGWALFLGSKGGTKTARREAARRWFRRSYPEET